eukprot:TRINITY_DN123641_c0_g1_i1.p1 TRINITY_DN123641_c0_g1~~TRINITY_DN123641_c0_g1_i1.p1  ORF type:complete len:222 (-),score=33.92 TRINITY_DN123641_c0_g1_i1:318-983(-)
MVKFTEVLAIVLSFCSFLSSVCYTWVYVQGQKATFFDQLYSSYSTPEMMSSFDTLESFLANTGPETYASEYVRLKSLARDTYTRMKSGVVDESDKQSVLLGKDVDGSRRHLLHYLGKVLMLYRTGYVTKDMLHEFPGRTRAVHFLKLLQPLIKATSISFNVALEEHQQILRGIKGIYGINDEEIEMKELPGCNGNGNSAACAASWTAETGSTGGAVAHDEA